MQKRERKKSFPYTAVRIQQEKHEKLKAEIENAIYDLEQQKEQLNNRQVTFSILIIINFILFFYILYKHKDNILRVLNV